MGSALSKSLSKGNYRLLLKASKYDASEALAKEIKSTNPSADVEAMSCPKDAGWETDIIIVAVPFSAEKEVAESIREVANQKIVISLANPVNETYNGLVPSSESSAAEELQKLLPHSKVIKAFNTVFATDFSTPVIDGKQVDTFIVGNDDEALQTVSELVSTAGLNPIIAGDLSVSRTLEKYAAAAYSTGYEV